MKNAVIVVLAVLGIALGGYIFVQQKEVAALRAQLSEASAERGLIGMSARPSPEVQTLRKEVEDLEVKLAEAAAGQRGGNEPRDSAAGGEKNKEAGKDASAAMMEGFAKMMNDPAMEGVMKQQQRIAVNGMYGDFFRDLGLPPDQEEIVRALLLDKQMAVTRRGMALLDRTMPDEERQAIADGLKDDMERFREEIKTTLGDENYESFKLFEESQPERQQLNSYKETLQAKGLALDVETEQELMTAMYDARKAFKFTTDFGTDTNPNPEAWKDFNQESAERMMAESRQLHERFHEKAGSILTAEQLGAFRESLDGFQKMQEMGIKMSLGFVREKAE